MRRLHFTLLAAALAIGCDDPTSPTVAGRSDQPAFTTTSRRYSGLAVAAQVTVAGFTQTVVQAGPLPPSGGTKSYSLLGPIKVDSILTASGLNASVDGRYNRSISFASVSSLTLKKAGNTIRLTKVSATARAECGYRRSGSSQIYELKVNGAPVSLTGQPNQTIELPNGKLVVNEQRQSSKSNSITVTALRLVITGEADVVVSQAQAGILC